MKIPQAIAVADAAGGVQAINLHAVMLIAAAAHGATGETRADGVTPYIVHPLRVAELVLEWGSPDVDAAKARWDPGTDVVAAAALLHDVVEDTALSVDALAELGVPARVLEIVALLTKDRNEPGDGSAYYARIAGDPAAVFVKCADRCANLEDACREVLAGGDLDRWNNYLVKTGTDVLPLMEPYPALRRELMQRYRALGEALSSMALLTPEPNPIGYELDIMDGEGEPPFASVDDVATSIAQCLALVAAVGTGDAVQHFLIHEPELKAHLGARVFALAIAIGEYLEDNFDATIDDLARCSQDGRNLYPSEERRDETIASSRECEDEDDSEYQLWCARQIVDRAYYDAVAAKAISYLSDRGMTVKRQEPLAAWVDRWRHSLVVDALVNCK